jgi:MFS family permease
VTSTRAEGVPVTAPGRGGPLLVALSVGLVLSDSSVVTLALPAILREFDASVSAVAWVLIAFNLALTLAAVPCWFAARRAPRMAFGLASAGFAVASLACAAAPSLAVLVAARAAQGVIGAILVAAALELLVLGSERRRAIGLWAAAGVLGGALGPALGGFLTEAFSWEAMFALQAPVVLVALLGLRRVPVVIACEESRGERPAFAPLAALALVSAALAAALFLLVIMLIEGWRLSPGEAALVVSAMPLAALVAGRWARAAHRLAPALPGSVLLAGGLAALGLLPGTGALWTIAPQLAIGCGLGLALGALIGVMADAEGDGAVGRPAAWTIAARHAGIVLGLLVLTPIFTADLGAAREPAERAGVAHLLDAPISLKPKIALARSLSAAVTDAAGQELPDLDAGFAAVDVPADERAAVAALHDDLDGEIDGAATNAFSRAFLAAALLALLAAVAVAVAVARARPPLGPASANGRRAVPIAGLAPDAAGSLAPVPSLNVALPAACAIATALVAAYVALGGASYGPTPVADPCAPRERPVDDKTQRVALATIDGTACALGRGREELLLALLDGKRPDGVSDGELSGALVKGIDRAEDEGELGSIAATGLRLAIRTGGVLGIVGLLLPD